MQTRARQLLCGDPWFCERELGTPQRFVDIPLPLAWRSSASSWHPSLSRLGRGEGLVTPPPNICSLRPWQAALAPAARPGLLSYLAVVGTWEPIPAGTKFPTCAGSSGDLPPPSPPAEKANVGIH